jgi:hypothetical protein
MQRLFHISDEPGIARFDPRPANEFDSSVVDAAVWAIDEEHLPNYLVPRDCPRVRYYGAKTTRKESGRHLNLVHEQSIRSKAGQPGHPHLATPAFRPGQQGPSQQGTAGKAVGPGRRRRDRDPAIRSGLRDAQNLGP